MARIIGLDFGTTNTRLQLGYSDAPERTSPLQPPNADRDALPSVILLDEGGQVLEDMGRAAVRALLDPVLRDRVRHEFKPCLGRSEEDLAQQTAALVLELRCPSCDARIPEGFLFCGKCGKPLPDDYRKTIAERALKYEREEAFGYASLLLTEIGTFLRRSALGDGWQGDDLVVVGVPVHWTEGTRRRYGQMVAEAFGMDRVESVAEPRAALAEYLWRAGSEVRAGDTVLVVDVGGGTTDLVAGTVQEDGTLGGDVSTSGIRYGGADFDDRIVLWALRQIDLPATVDEGQAAVALRPVCRDLKEELCDAVRRRPEEANPKVKMPVITRDFNADLELDKATFEGEEVCGPLIALFGVALAKGVADMGLRAEDVRHAILVGGGSNAYFVGDATRVTFPEAKIVAGQQPEVAVSRGLVLAMGPKPLPTAASETVAKSKSKGQADDASAPVVDAEEVGTGGSGEAARAGSSPMEAVRFVRDRLDRGDTKDELRERLRAAGWSEEVFEKVWARAAKGRHGDAHTTPSVMPPLPADSGLWGPAETFPEVVDNLEAGRWEEARERADILHRRNPGDPQLSLMLLFVRLLADVADRSYMLDGGEGLHETANRLVSRIPRSGMARYLRSVATLLRLPYTEDTSVKGGYETSVTEDAEISKAVSPKQTDGQFVAAVLEGIERDAQLLGEGGTVTDPPVTILGHLLLAAALQVTAWNGGEGSRALNTSQSIVRGLETDSLDFSSDPGLLVLEPWRKTPLEPQVLRWLGGCSVENRGVGRIAAYRRLVEVLEKPLSGEVDLLAVAEAEWVFDLMRLGLLATEYDWSPAQFAFVARDLLDRAATTAWQYVRTTAPDAAVVLSSGTRPGVAVLRAGHPLMMYGGSLVLHLPDSARHGCVLREVLVQAAKGLSIWLDGFSHSGSFYPFAGIKSISFKEGTVWDGVTVEAVDGNTYLADQVWSKANSGGLRDSWDVWRDRWHDIANGIALPEREWLSVPAAVADDPSQTETGWVFVDDEG